MALVILSILTVLGLVFLGVISRNIRNAGRMDQRSKATDLAEAGIRYAHFQLLHSQLGADWRPIMTSLAPVGTDITVDPDVFYLRPGTGRGLRNAADPQIDLGGPDGLGPFTRINYEGGRALVRVRFAPSDSNLFSTDPSGSIRNPGRTRYYTIIEAVGRPGIVNRNDPTTLPNTGGVIFRNYGSDAQFRAEFAKMKDRDTIHVSSRKVTAFASIGIIESARYMTNKYNVSRDAEIGVPDLGVAFEGSWISGPNATRPLAVQIGNPTQMPNLGNPPTPGGQIPFGGGLWSNANLMVYGDLVSNLNYTLADMIAVYGSVLGADSSAALHVAAARWNPTGGNWQQTLYNLTNAGNPSLDSRSNFFSTLAGLIRDAYAGQDAEGYSRWLTRKDPPTILQTDPDTGQLRYLELTRNSGQIINQGNAGRFGHGRGVYVNNVSDRQMRSDESGRIDVGSAESLVHDWLNPNSEGGSWKGPFYVPRGAFVQLLRDGFSITRDSRAPNQERTWRAPDGTNTGSTIIRYRLGRYDFDGDGVQEWSIINSFTPNANINAPSPNWGAGQPFNGILYFEGNVRVRGIIPTDVQLTIVSNATIYIEGSITKGVTDANGFINRPSLSMLGLFAKDYVALNTTQFFGPATLDLDEPNEEAGAVAVNPVRMQEPNGAINLRFEELLDPLSAATPNLWQPYPLQYRQFNDPNPGQNTGSPITQFLMTMHTQEDGAAPYSFISLDVNYGVGNAPPATPWSYLFPMSPNNAATGFYPPGYVTPGYTTPNYVPIYGLGVENWQRYSKFESIGFPMVRPQTATFAGGTINANDAEGRYRLFVQETSDITWRPNNVGAATNSYYLARAAIVPQDVRIEAAIYAEEGSFFVIPGPWFNPNPNDTRDRFDARVAQVGQAQAEQERLEAFGSYPEMPFYQEPLDVRVQIIGAVSENMPPPIAQQAEWLKKWGWIPRKIGSTNILIPKTHVPAVNPLTGGFYDIRDSGQDRFVPNLIITYDPSLATARVGGFDASDYVRYRWFDFNGDGVKQAYEEMPLPPLPSLPVSPTLAFFGEVNP
jgi:hypothetical protein